MCENWGQYDTGNQGCADINIVLGILDTKIY